MKAKQNGNHYNKRKNKKQQKHGEVWVSLLHIFYTKLIGMGAQKPKMKDYTK